ncbi:MAG: phosphodiester glycosidase family protein [Lachnospiraceae bacterium]|nr:phosphodiester glycosidase family protein [Lachnospiraceae bacterium]
MNEKKKKRNKIATGISCFALWFFGTIVLILAGFFVMLYLIHKGPSPRFRDLFVASAKESSVGGVLVDLYLSPEEVDKILAQNKTQEFTEITDTSLVQIDTSLETDTGSPTVSDNPEDPDGDGITVYDVHGPTYRGKMMVVFDPSRVKVATIDHYGLSTPGKTLPEFVEMYDAVAGINGGKYDDEAGIGTGGMPEGIVFSEGKLRMGDPGSTYGVYGFTNDNVLVCGYMTAAYAQSIGVRDAVTFGPALIVNGKSAKMAGSGSGLNPRTAIGQRADGAVLLLVIEGRQTTSLGASMADLVTIMEEYGAVNAANLDGGMSSSMVYNGEEIVSSCTMRNRKIPTAFIVERRD